MHIAFIGMSNIGKTYWSRKMAAAQGIAPIDCDALIEARLGDELTRLGYRGLSDVAKWMGQPPDARYAETSAKYVECEVDVMRETLARLNATAQPAIIDTTGSVIYTGDMVLADLRARACVVYLEASETHSEALFQRYLKHPKPVIWGDAYAPAAGEAPGDTLRRCYPVLLRERAQRYKALAHVTIAFDMHKNRGLDMASLISCQRNAS